MQLLKNLNTSFNQIVDNTPASQFQPGEKYTKEQKAHKAHLDELENTLKGVNDDAVQQLHSAIDAKEEINLDLSNAGDPNPIQVTNYATWTSVATRLTELVKKLNPNAEFQANGKLAA